MNPITRPIRFAIDKWLQPMVKNKVLDNYTVELTGGAKKGDGFLGDVNFVEVSAKSRSNKEDTIYNLAIKSSKNSEALRKILPIKIMCQNEMHFYNKVMPTFERFQGERRIKAPFKNVPSCYDSLMLDDMEIVLLKNMLKEDYRMHDRTQPLDKEHVRKVAKTYGKLHALSFALRDQDPEVFDDLGNGLVDVLRLITNANELPKEDGFFINFHKMAEQQGEPELAEKILLLPKITDTTDPTDPFAVIVHGDCWNNNYLFRYKVSSLLSRRQFDLNSFLQDDQQTLLADVCLLDFQFSRLTSPIYDLSYFIFSSISEEDIKNFDEINTLYYESLFDFLKQLGSDADQMFPFDEFMNEWRKYGRIGLRMMFSVIRNCLMEPNEIFDLKEVVESGKEMDCSSRTLERCCKRTFPLLQLAVDKKII
jgi:thiamine kinase-like enzyme